ncbi:MAG: saccharopine dehydrogenase family protein [Pseudomonadota bacterium]|jgi:saccharopine dehydrogenase-like NADP-dependent oxidoreductase
MHTVALFGAGKIGEAITALLCSSGRYQVRVCDGVLSQAQKISACWPSASAHLLDVNNPAEMKQVLTGCALVLSALPYSCNAAVAKAAADCDIGYADLTEDVRTSQQIAHLASTASSWFMPQCGIAPGFISIAAAHLCTLMDSVHSLKMRVGALPIYPTNKLKYNLTWSTDGLINEYCNPCEVLINGNPALVPPLEGYERFSLDGCEYEAFNTSGGLGSICQTLQGRVRDVTYKTIRYPGHRDLMAFLLDDLKFSSDRESLKKLFDRSLPTTTQDKCIILVEATGTIGSKFTQKTYASTVYNQNIAGRHLGAIQLTTAAGICGAIDLVLSGALGMRKGFIKIEEIPLKSFLANEFGKLFLDPQALSDL